MKEYIARAMRERHLVRLVHERKRLTVEPHVLGQTLEGQEAMLAWQVSPPTTGGTQWRLLPLDKIMELQILEQSFETEGGERRPLTDGFSRIETRA